MFAEHLNPRNLRRAAAWSVVLAMSLAIGSAGAAPAPASRAVNVASLPVNVPWLTAGTKPGEKVRPLTAEDFFEIEQLYYRYAYALDTGDGPGRAATFVPDGGFSGLMSKHQPETPATLAKRTNDAGNTGSRHMQYNIILAPTAEGARGSCYVLIIMKSGRAKPDGSFPTLTGFYEDTLVRTPRGWRFKTRHIWQDQEPGSPYKPRPE